MSTKDQYSKKPQLVQMSFLDNPPSISSPKAEPIRLEFELADRIRRETHEGIEYLSLVDMMAEFSGSDTAKRYWSDIKHRLAKDGFEGYAKIVQLKLVSKDGKKRSTDCADRETCLRIVQSIPSPKAEPIRLWLASLGNREIDETQDPESAIHRTLNSAVDQYQKSGKDNEWITERLKGIDARKTLTNAIAGALSDIPDNMYKQTTETLYRGLWERVTAILRQDLGMPAKGGNVRDHFGTYALIYTGLAERVAGELITQAGDLTPAIVMEIVWKVATMIKQQADATSQFLGRDLVTDKPLLTGGAK